MKRISDEKITEVKSAAIVNESWSVPPEELVKIQLKAVAQAQLEAGRAEEIEDLWDILKYSGSLQGLAQRLADYISQLEEDETD